MVWRQEKILRTNLQPNPSFRATSGYVTVRTNLCTNPSFPGNDLTGWGRWPGTGNPTSTLLQSTGTGADNKAGYMSQMWSQPPTSGGGMYWPLSGVAVTPNTTYTASAYVRCSKPVQVSAQIQWYAGTMSNPTTAGSGDSVNIPANTWTRVYGTVTSDATATLGQFRWYIGSGGLAANDTFDIDCVLIEESATLNPYFDGSTTNGTFDLNLESAWTGTANASTSVARGLALADWTNTSNNSRAWQAEDGQSAYLRNTTATTWPNGIAPLYSGATMPVQAGVPYTGSLRVLGTYGGYITLQGYSSTSAGTISSPGSVGETTNGDTATITYTFPTTATVGARLIFRARTGGVPPGATIRLAQAMIEQTDTSKPFFDGSYASTKGLAYRWNGAVDRSSSDMYIPALNSPVAGTWDSSQYGYSESWIVDGVDIQSMAFGVTTAESTPPDLRGGHLSIPGRNGVLPQFNRSYEPGSVTLKMWVLGCDTDGVVPGTRAGRRQLFERNLRALIRLFGYQGNTITLSRTLFGDYLDSSVPNKVTARAIVEGFTSIETMMARQRAEMTVVLTLVDSFWSDVDKTTDSTTASATVPQTLNISNTGTAPIDDSVITITGPITAPKITCAASGSWIQYNDALAAGQTLVIDSGNGTAKVGNTSVITKVAHGGTSRFMVIPPRDSSIVTDLGFTPALTMTGTSASSATKFSVSYNRKHLVIV